MNDDLIQSAVSFLKDPNVSASPLNKKIEFLQAKGLNEQEIEEALNRAKSVAAASSLGATASPTAPQVSTQYTPPVDYYNVQPPVPERTWKDYFIMATATAGVTFGLYQVVSKYLIPSIVPPSQTTIDEDKQKIDEEFIKIDKLLEQLAVEQKEIKQANDEKLQEIETTISSVNEFLSKYNKDKLTFDDDLRLMKLEIDNLKNNIEKNLNLTRENLTDELKDINQELASLKNLINVRSQSKENNSRAKLAPVSSIPSASEILKKAKAKSGEKQEAPASAPVTPSVPATETPEISKPEASAAPKALEEEVEPGATKAPTAGASFNGVTAAGIPSWQLQHKLQEEMSGKTKEDDFINNTIKNVGVPSWQLNQSSA